jgi:hypothetical protein
LDRNQEIQEFGPGAPTEALNPKSYAFVPSTWCKKIRAAGAPAVRSENLGEVVHLPTDLKYCATARAGYRPEFSEKEHGFRYSYNLANPMHIVQKRDNEVTKNKGDTVANCLFWPQSTSQQ